MGLTKTTDSSVIEHSSLCGPLGILLAVLLVCTFSRQYDACCSLTSCAQLDSVYVLVIAWGVCIVQCVSLKFVGWSMVVSVTWQYFQRFAGQWSPGNIVWNCRSESPLSQFLVSLAIVATMAVEFAVFLPRTKSFNVLATYCDRVYSIFVT